MTASSSCQGGGIHLDILFDVGIDDEPKEELDKGPPPPALSRPGALEIVVTRVEHNNWW